MHEHVKVVPDPSVVHKLCLGQRGRENQGLPAHEFLLCRAATRAEDPAGRKCKAGTAWCRSVWAQSWTCVREWCREASEETEDDKRGEGEDQEERKNVSPNQGEMEVLAWSSSPTPKPPPSHSSAGPHLLWSLLHPGAC